MPGSSGLQKNQQDKPQSLRESADNLLWGDASDSTDHVSDTSDSDTGSPIIP